MANKNQHVAKTGSGRTMHTQERTLHGDLTLSPI